MRRLVLAAAVPAVLAGLALPSLAAPRVPVGVQTDTKGRVFVGVTVNGQPGAAVQVQNGIACAGIGEGVPFCAGPGPITVR